YRICCPSDESATFGDVRTEAIKFTQNQFFLKHKQDHIEENHFATVIIIIPPFCNELEHNGGNIKIWNERDKLYEINSSEITKITVLAFNPKLQYEITQITSGTLFILRTDWSYCKRTLDLVKMHDKFKMEHVSPIDLD